MLDHLFNNSKTRLIEHGYGTVLFTTQDREDFLFNGKTMISDLGHPGTKGYRSLCKKANELNKLDGEWGIHHWVAKL